MGKGRRYEHELTNGLDKVTPPEVWTATVGWSGNANRDNCDIVVLIDPKLQTRHAYSYHIEAKKRSGKEGNRIVVFGGSKSEETGIEELRRLVETTPDWGQPVVVVSFDRRKPITLDARWLLHELGEQNGVAPPASVQMHSVDVTDSGLVVMVKPTLAEWDSASASPSDGTVVARQLELPCEQ